MDSATEAEVGGIFHNDQTVVPLRITLNELVFYQPPTPTKTDNYADEGIVTNTARQNISRVMDMILYWVKDRVKKNDLFADWKPGIQNMGYYFTKNHPPPNIKP